MGDEDMFGDVPEEPEAVAAPVETKATATDSKGNPVTVTAKPAADGGLDIKIEPPKPEPEAVPAPAVEEPKPAKGQVVSEKQAEMVLEKLLEHGYTGTVKIEYCRFRKKLTHKDLDLKKDEVPEEIIALGQKRLLKKSFLEKIQSIESKARDLVLTYSTESFLKGYRYFTKKGRDAVLGELLKLKAEFASESKKFIESYPAMKEAMLKEFPEWAKKLEPFFPSVGKVTAGFGFEIIGLSDDYKITLVRQEGEILAEAKLQIKEDLMGKLNSFLKSSVLDVRTEFIEKLSAIKDKIDAGDKINAKTIKKVQEMIEEAKLKDLTGDQDFFAMLDDFGKKFTPEAAKSENFKAEIEKSLTAVLDAAKDEKSAETVAEKYVHRSILV